jgi:hypothetical protein
VDCNISIVSTGQIREKLEVIIEAQHRHWQQLLREATKMEMAEESTWGRAEGRRDSRDEDIDHGDRVIVEGSPSVTFNLANCWSSRIHHSSQDLTTCS